MLHARLVHLWRRILAWLYRRPTRIPAGWEAVTPLEADPEYLDLLIWLHATDTGWFLRMSRQLPGSVDSP